MVSAQTQIASLQAGRALAALAVVISHATLAAQNFGGPGRGAPFMENGYLGVDFFFVLSGFIIYHSSQNKTLIQYSRARMRRVYLPYLPIGVGIALLYSLLPQLSETVREWSWLPTLTLFPVSADTALSVAWTLKHELFFYFLFALFWFSGTLIWGLLGWALSIAISSLVLDAPPIPLSLINLEFLLGIGVAVAYRRGWGSPGWYLASLLPLGLWVWFGAQREMSVLVGLALAAIILPTVRMEARGKFRVPTPLLLIGGASYSIYLAHGLTISLVGRLLEGSHWWTIFLSASAAGTLGGLVYYYAVEEVLLRRKNSHAAVLVRRWRTWLLKAEATK